MISAEGSHCKKKGIVNTRPLRSFLMLVVLAGLGLMPAGGAQSLTILHQAQTGQHHKHEKRTQWTSIHNAFLLAVTSFRGNHRVDSIKFAQKPWMEPKDGE